MHIVFSTGKSFYKKFLKYGVTSVTSVTSVVFITLFSVHLVTFGTLHRVINTFAHAFLFLKIKTHRKTYRRFCFTGCRLIA